MQAVGFRCKLKRWGSQVESCTKETSPFHAGKQALRAHFGVHERMEVAGRHLINPEMPMQYRAFYWQLLFLVIGALNKDRRCAAGIVFVSPGFVETPNACTMVLSAGDPVGLHGNQQPDRDTRSRSVPRRPRPLALRMWRGGPGVDEIEPMALGHAGTNERPKVGADRKFLRQIGCRPDEHPGLPDEQQQFSRLSMMPTQPGEMPAMPTTQHLMKENGANK